MNESSYFALIGALVAPLWPRADSFVDFVVAIEPIIHRHLAYCLPRIVVGTFAVVEVHGPVAADMEADNFAVEAYGFADASSSVVDGSFVVIHLIVVGAAVDPVAAFDSPPE